MNNNHWKPFVWALSHSQFHYTLTPRPRSGLLYFLSLSKAIWQALLLLLPLHCHCQNQIFQFCLLQETRSWLYAESISNNIQLFAEFLIFVGLIQMGLWHFLVWMIRLKRMAFPLRTWYRTMTPGLKFKAGNGFSIFVLFKVSWVIRLSLVSKKLSEKESSKTYLSSYVCSAQTKKEETSWLCVCVCVCILTVEIFFECDYELFVPHCGQFIEWVFLI